MNRFRKAALERANQESQKEKHSSALRQFNEAPVGEAPSFWQTKFGLSIFWLIPLVIFFLITIAGITAVVILKKPKLSNMEAFGTSSSPVDMLKEESRSGNPLENFLSAYGGRAALVEVNSIIVMGQMQAGEQVWDVEIQKKSPTAANFVISGEADESQTIEVRGKLLTRVPTEASTSDASLALSAKESDSLITFTQLFNPFIEAALGGVTDLAVDQITSEGRKHYLVRLDGVDGGSFESRIDYETRYLKSVEEKIALADSTVTRRIEYGDYRSVAGLVLPYQINVYYDGQLFRSLNAHRMTINPVSEQE